MEDAVRIHTLFKAQTGSLSSSLCLGAVWTLPLGVLVRVQEEGEEMVGHRNRRGVNIIYSLWSVSLDISLRSAQETLRMNVFTFTFMHFADAFIKSDLQAFRLYIFYSTFCLLLCMCRVIFSQFLNKRCKFSQEEANNTLNSFHCLDELYMHERIIWDNKYYDVLCNKFRELLVQVLR